ncbi:MAG: ABC transporter ATP-binding protein [Methyloprofundus sp.]|nr:ABC transporter ATP-binding protein [Methyloprofundus sp.]
MIAIKAVNLGKTYKIYSKPSDSLLEFIFRHQRHEKMVAIAGISFELQKGETLGIVGDNGAGKSTLLKLLAGTIAPSEGVRLCNGRLSAILELGSGFHPEFSGVENARMGCALLGLSPKEIEQAIPDIHAFSELGDFFYKPVKTYSSGMYVRLAFSVVTTVDPEVLIVDEALSVGDQHFQKKSLDRMQAFKDAGKTIVFCSHNLYQVKELCDKAIWLNNGRMIEFGRAAEVVDNYQDSIREHNVEDPGYEQNKRGSSAQDNRIMQVTVFNSAHKADFVTGELLAIDVQVALTTLRAEDVNIGIVIMRNDNIHCYGVSTQIDQVRLQHERGEVYRVTLKFEQLQLLSGRYYLCVYLLDAEGVHVYSHWEQCAPFVVRSSTSEVGVARLEHQWS